MANRESIDCVEMKRKAALALHARLSKLTPEERIALWDKTAAEIRTRQAASAAGSAADGAAAKPGRAKPAVKRKR